METTDAPQSEQLVFGGSVSTGMSPQPDRGPEMQTEMGPEPLTRRAPLKPAHTAHCATAVPNPRRIPRGFQTRDAYRALWHRFTAKTTLEEISLHKSEAICASL
ncbi:hypothetical protein EYF80_036901 [Liparis tanakae]|uniref:Uncharacterized protein n=1 Tax=Liparis tanakae TaxID=230148 RepID=A0A4Z2GH68_9TELE|nr:hypothetical protein EYF80_036901 [Liparis tanakae]